MSPPDVQSHQRISGQSGIAENLFISAIQNILYSQNQIDVGTERIASAQTHFLISGTTHDSEPDAIRVLALTDDCHVDIHEGPPKRRCEIERTRMARASR